MPVRDDTMWIMNQLRNAIINTDETKQIYCNNVYEILADFGDGKPDAYLGIYPSEKEAIQAINHLFVELENRCTVCYMPRASGVRNV